MTTPMWGSWVIINCRNSNFHDPFLLVQMFKKKTRPPCDTLSNVDFLKWLVYNKHEVELILRNHPSENFITGFNQVRQNFTYTLLNFGRFTCLVSSITILNWPHLLWWTNPHCTLRLVVKVKCGNDTTMNEWQCQNSRFFHKVS